VSKAPEISQDLALSTFDTVWLRIDETDFDPEHGGVDWDAVRDELRPKAMSATSNRELRAVLYDMVSRLGRSHFAVIPGEIADQEPPPSGGADESDDEPSDDHAHDDPHESHDHAHHDQDPDEADATDDENEWATFGLDLRIVEHKATVVSVEPDSPAAKAGVRPGWVLESIDGGDPLASVAELREAAGPLARYAAEAYVRELDRGTRRRRHTLVFRDLDEQEQRLRIRRAPTRESLVKVGTLPLLPVRVEHRWLSPSELESIDARGRRIGVIRFTTWMPSAAEPIDRAVDELRDADGIVIDLRGNPGGFGGMVMGVGGHFVNDPISLGSMSTRDTTIEFRLNPRRVTRDGRAVDPISAPLAILVDPLSASTSEVFAGGIQDVGRARVFGETSAGAVLPAAMLRLPNGDVLLHAFADYHVPSGTRLEGRGVIPDQPRTLTRAALAAENDPVLMDAARWIRDSGPPVP
ncbi:MAG: hypothetical protein FJ253_11210, partial [Phycisphaerae bacterium]|nr:hypothetical protein [Phycisphaerae bacterium]